MEPRYPILDPGLLRHLVQIQSPKLLSDAAGQPVDDWNSELTAWASIETVNSVERYQSAQFTGEVTHLITMRWTQSIVVKPTMRVLFGSQVYKIQNVNNVRQLNVAIELQCLALNEGSDPS